MCIRDRNQMASAVASIVALFLIYLSEMLVTNFDGEGKIKTLIYKVVTAFAFYSRYIEFTQGIFSLPSVVFFLSTAFLFNFFTVRVLEKKRWS